MKKFLLIFIAFITFSIHASVYSANVNVEDSDENNSIVVFEDNFYPRINNKDLISIPLLSLKERLSSKSSNIRIKGENIPDYILDCADKARSLWSSIIQDSLECEIEIRFEPLQCDIKTEVKYHSQNGVNYPNAYWSSKELSSQQNQFSKTEEDKNAGTIIINSDEIWDTYTGDNIDTTKKNLTFGLIRAMCRIFGFGSPIILNSEPNDYRYPMGIRNHSIFDLLVQRSDNSLLKDINCMPNRANSKLVDFITYPDAKFYVKDSANSYQLADPPYSASNLPFAALKDGLMAPDVTIGDHILQIDEATIGVMKMMGWDTNRKEIIGIVCTDTLCESIVDPMQSHSFEVRVINNGSHDKVDNSLKGGQWRLSIPLKNSDQNEIIYFEDEDGSCTVPPFGKFENINKYAVDVNGITEARLDYCFEQNGLKYRTYPYVLNILRQPSIDSVTIMEPRWISSSRYVIDFKVRTRGAEYVEVESLEEFSQLSRSQIIYEYPTAEGSSTAFFSEGYAWLVFTVKNSVGKAEYIVEITPQATEWYPLETTNGADVSFSKSIWSETDGLKTNYKIYDMFGRLLWTGNDLSSITGVLPNTPVIIQYEKNGETRSIKYIKR